MAQRQYQKLSQHYFGPFQISQKISLVTYNLFCHPNLVYTLFFIFLFSKSIGPLPPETENPTIKIKEHKQILSPKAILDKRTIQDGNNSIDQVLIQWDVSIPEDKTWKNLPNFEDKAAEDGRDDTNQSTTKTREDVDRGATRAG